MPVAELLAGGYIEAFDEEPLPVAVADRACQRLLDLVPARTTASQTSIVLQHATSGIDRVKHERRDAGG